MSTPEKSLPCVRDSCIWCNKRFLITGEEVVNDRDCKRSKEHIIPESIFGSLVTHDLCEDCNSVFGWKCDYGLAEDHNIITAAGKAGYDLTKIQSSFRGARTTTSGREVNVHYRDGKIINQPQLDPQRPLAVAGEDWHRLRSGFKKSLIARVVKKTKTLPKDEIEARVSQLFSKVDADPHSRHYDEILGEGIEPSTTVGPIKVEYESFPWITQWSLAKICYELGLILWPASYQIYFKDALAVFRGFIEREQPGIGEFDFDILKSDPANGHSIEFNLMQTAIECQLTFFGTAQWSWRRNVVPILCPTSAYKIRITNPIGGATFEGSTVVSWTIKELG